MQKIPFKAVYLHGVCFSRFECFIGFLHQLQPCIGYLRMSSESAEIPSLKSSVVTKTIRVKQASQEHDLIQLFPGGLVTKAETTQ